MDSGLKTRLIGALVLIALAVIFVPMLLPGGGNGSSASIKVPPEPNGALQTRVLQVGPDSATAGASTQAAVVDPDHVATLDLDKHAAAVASAAAVPVASAPVAAVPASEPTKAPPASASASAGVRANVPPKPSAAPASAIAKAPTPAAPTSAVATRTPYPMPPLAGGAGAAAGAIYTVNLGIYADHASADKLVANAKRAGFTALASPETFNGKPVLRVRVGPFGNRAEAEAARLKLKDSEHVPMTVDGAVLNQSGDAPASALAATQPGGWAVQLVAYADEAAADKLRDRLRGQGFDGYVDSVKTAKGTFWRVRAGPYTSRDVAAENRTRIAEKLKITGNIVTQD